MAPHTTDEAVRAVKARIEPTIFHENPLPENGAAWMTLPSGSGVKTWRHTLRLSVV